MASACGRGGCSRPFVSELGALTAEPGFCGSRLHAPVERIAADFRLLGEAVAVTSNTTAVMTRIGHYGPPQFTGEPLRCDPEATCVRLETSAIDTALAVERMPVQRLPCSLQFYCPAGAVLHKCFLTQCRDDLDFARLTDLWAGPAETHADSCRSPSPARPEGDCAAQLDSVFGDSGLTRRSQLPGWGGTRAWRVAPELALNALALAAEIRMPLSQMVGNAGAAQIHNGPLEQVRRSQALVILRSGCCTLSFDGAEIEEAWVTCYRSPSGEAHMLELYDWRFHCVAQFAAPGLPDPGLGGYWRQVLLSLGRIGGG
ncbi:hypothetical protein MWN34_08670 [Ancylobacter sp. 6x-1]|uniref:Haemin-degrading HemS/ChuX domain-containing protein n=1 Tax=Ancylobacter crimeensis TaxID=2579147 RepID=A0ABT0DAK6_9HYPH|nr:ChuX/HutX family heme-like substrate-binding protein [Ancylobacter crimeensis]MCK0196986.1 hypothetical protein [Ancylobacter crimeensis]